MGETLLEEFLEGARRFGQEVSFEASEGVEVHAQGAIFDRDLSPDELEAVVELVTIGLDEPVEGE